MHLAHWFYSFIVLSAGRYAAVYQPDFGNCQFGQLNSELFTHWEVKHMKRYSSSIRQSRSEFLRWDRIGVSVDGQGDQEEPDHWGFPPYQSSSLHPTSRQYNPTFKTPPTMHPSMHSPMHHPIHPCTNPCTAHLARQLKPQSDPTQGIQNEPT